jgi:soluble lytic murein transglycosylase-like protein
MRMFRGSSVCGAALLLAGLIGPAVSLAGSQLEEPLADAVRSALSAAISSDDRTRLVLSQAGLHATRDAWVQKQWPVLTIKLRRASLSGWRHEWGPVDLQRELLETVWYEATRARLEPELVLALIEVESDFRKFAVSSAGALGLMQVMPFWGRLLADVPPRHLFHLQTNLRFGCVILRHYLDLEQGDLTLALGRYNGSRGQTTYPNAVLSARARWAAGTQP